MHKASMRASEIPDEVLRRKQSNEEAMASKQKSNVPVEHVILYYMFCLYYNEQECSCRCIVQTCKIIVYRREGGESDWMRQLRV